MNAKNRESWVISSQAALWVEGSQTKDKEFWRRLKMFNEKEFINRVLELVESSKTQRDGVGLKLVEEFNLPGKHKATRLVQEYFGCSLSAILKLKFEYPEDWKTRLPNAAVDRLDKPDMFTRISELRKTIFQFHKAKEILMKEYDLTEMELVRRVRSFMQKPLSEVFYPTDEEIQECLIRANSSEEFKELLGMPAREFTGLLDKKLGVSNFTQAKAKCLNKVKVSNINPCTSDNESIVFSQVLGDGSYDKTRKSLRITHGIKQLSYLRLKVTLLKNAYPELYGVEKIKCLVHTQGHEYCTWYSGKLPEHVTTKIEAYTSKQFLEELTPLGIFLLFLDDGCLFWKDSKSLSFSIGRSLQKHEELKALLASYGLHSNAYEVNCVIARQADIIKFLNMFVKPFSHIVPEALRYKTEIMI